MKRFKRFLYEALLAEASIKQVQEYWLQDNYEEDVKNSIAQFLKYKEAHQLNSSEVDISQWYKKPFEEFRDFLLKKAEEVEAKRKKKGKVADVAEKGEFFENEFVKIYNPKPKRESAVSAVERTGALPSQPVSIMRTMSARAFYSSW